MAFQEIIPSKPTDKDTASAPIDVPKDAKITRVKVDIHPVDADDAAAGMDVQIEESSDGVTWQHSCGFPWQGKALSKDGSLAVAPMIAFSAPANRKVRVLFVGLKKGMTCGASMEVA